MLRFILDPKNLADRGVDLQGAYLVGSDGVPLRAEIELAGNELCCAKRVDGPAGISLPWPVNEAGVIMLDTSRLTDREKPYNLAVELTRGRLMRISQKREEWGLFDFDGFEPVAAEIDKARGLFVEALKTDAPADQTRIAERALQTAILSGEQLSHFYAELFLTRRKQAHAFSKRAIGCTVDIAKTSDEYRQALHANFDYAYLPISWCELEPKHQEHNWRTFDVWVEWLTKNRMPIKVGPLVSFRNGQVPDWLSTYEADFEAIRNMIFEHVRRVVERYGNYVHQWDVVSGLHADNVFGFTFEQLMELTRVTASLAKQLAPRAQTIVDIIMPWGEYYARNQRTIPPMLYADMVVQSGVGFDGLGVQFLFGTGGEGGFVRDMLQISEKLERLGTLGKTLHISAVHVPSAPLTKELVAAGGCWRKPWNLDVQARWVKEFYTIALSKPFVESVTWRGFVDSESDDPGPKNVGLLKADLSPKPAFKVVKDLRTELANLHRKPPAQQRAEKS